MLRQCYPLAGVLIPGGRRKMWENRLTKHAVVWGVVGTQVSWWGRCQVAECWWAVERPFPSYLGGSWEQAQPKNGLWCPWQRVNLWGHRSHVFTSLLCQGTVFWDRTGPMAELALLVGTAGGTAKLGLERCRPCRGAITHHELPPNAIFFHFAFLSLTLKLPNRSWKQ